MNKIAVYAIVGAAAGLLVAQFFPSLGKQGISAGLSDMAFSLGAQRPFLLDAAIGAVLGALLGLLTGKKR